MRPSSRWPKWPYSRDFYSAMASVLALMGFCFSAMANDSHVIKYAANPPYDNLPITPKTWEQVDLIYYSTISGGRYMNTAQLLRPIAWLHKRHMDVIGGKVTLSMPEFGIINALATVKAIKPTRANTHGFDWSKQKREYVIGRFMHYVTDARTYTFKDSLGHISHIIATPNHPFYVKNKHGFVAIGNVDDGDTLVGNFGFGDKHMDGAMHLVCAKGKHTHCGSSYGGIGLPSSVYNLEVYRRHVYRISTQSIIVHNDCEARELAKNRIRQSGFIGSNQNTLDIYFSSKFSSTCPVSSVKNLHHKDSSLLVLTFDQGIAEDKFLVEGFYDREAIKTQIKRTTESLWTDFNTPGRYSDDRKRFVEGGVAALSNEWNVPISVNNQTALTKMSLLSSYDVSGYFGGPLRSQSEGRPIEVFIDGNNDIYNTIDLARKEIYHLPLQP